LQDKIHPEIQLWSSWVKWEYRPLLYHGKKYPRYSSYDNMTLRTAMGQHNQ